MGIEVDGKAGEGGSMDLRRAKRHRALLGGKLVYGDGAFTVDCIVRDLSLTGARVSVPEGLGVPDLVYFLELRSATAYEARVIWKRYPLLGLEFIERYDIEHPTNPSMVTLKRLWTEGQQR